MKYLPIRIIINTLCKLFFNTWCKTPSRLKCTPNSSGIFCSKISDSSMMILRSPDASIPAMWLNAVVTNTWTSRCWVHLKGWKNSALIQYWKLFTTYIVVIKLWYCTKSELSFDFEEKTQTIKIKTPTNDRKYLQKDWKYESGEIECQLSSFFAFSSSVSDRQAKRNNNDEVFHGTFHSVISHRPINRFNKIGEQGGSSANLALPSSSRNCPGMKPGMSEGESWRVVLRWLGPDWGRSAVFSKVLWLPPHPLRYCSKWLNGEWGHFVWGLVDMLDGSS